MTSAWENGERIEKDQVVEQVWFAGAHTDIGGGYVALAKGDEEPQAALSDIPLEWIIAKAREQGLRIYSRHKIKMKPDALAKLHAA